MADIGVQWRAILAASAMCLAGGQATAGQLTIIHRFALGGPGGSDPVGRLVRDPRGDLYGVADKDGQQGGGGGNGVIFRLHEVSPGQWHETVLLRFPAVGSPPGPGLARDRAGALFGTVPIIDPSGAGIVYRLAPPTHGAFWNFQILHIFKGGQNPAGTYPSGSLLIDARGHVFGTTQAGGGVSGRFPCECGVAYELAAPLAGAGEWTESVLHAFGNPPDAALPGGGLSLGPDGTLFGTATQGGTGGCRDGSGVAVVGCGVVYQLNGLRGAWAEQVIYDFTAAQENTPTDTLTLGADGALYGIAGLDVYRLRPPAFPGAAWRHQVLYEFPGGIAGVAPAGAVVFDRHGNLYGTTRDIGIDGVATLYQLSPPATRDAPWLETTLATFPASKGFGPQPAGALLLGPADTLYGTFGSGNGQGGYVFAYTP